MKFLEFDSNEWKENFFSVSFNDLLSITGENIKLIKTFGSPLQSLWKIKPSAPSQFLNITLLVVTGILSRKSFPHKKLNSWFKMYTLTLTEHRLPFKDYILKCPSSGLYKFLTHLKVIHSGPSELDHLRYRSTSKVCVRCFQSQTL